MCDYEVPLLELIAPTSHPQSAILTLIWYQPVIRYLVPCYPS